MPDFDGAPLTPSAEGRIIEYLDKNLKEIKDTLKDQGAQIARITEDRVPRAEFDSLRRQMDVGTRDIALHEQRLTSLESSQRLDASQKRQAPFQKWQIWTGAIGLLLVALSTIMGTLLTSMGTLLGIANLIYNIVSHH